MPPQPNPTQRPPGYQLGTGIAFKTSAILEFKHVKTLPAGSGIQFLHFRHKPLRIQQLRHNVIQRLGVVALFAGSPYRSALAQVDTKQLALDALRAADQVTADQLADWLVEGRNDYLLVDVRDAQSFAAYHIPGAVNLPLSGLNHDFAQRNERVVFYSDNAIHTAQAWFLIRSLGFPSVYILAGGLETWQEAVLYPRAPAAGAAPKDQIDFAKRMAVAKFFGGSARGATSEVANPVAPVLPKLAPPSPTAPAPDNAQPAQKKKKEGC